jgi:hypothetical protein
MSLLLASLSLAQATTMTVTVDPLTTAIGFVHVQIEGKVSDSFSVYAGPHLRLFDGILTEEPEPYRGYGVEAGVRWFPTKHAPAGPWLMARGVGATLRTNDGKQTSPGGYASALVGWTMILGDHFVVAAGIGAQRLFYTVGDYGVSGFAPAAHSNLGVAF